MAASFSTQRCLPNGAMSSSSLLWKKNVIPLRISSSWSSRIKMPTLSKKRNQRRVNCMEGDSSDDGSYGKEDGDVQYVRFFYESWPYFLAHRASTFVLVISGEVVASPHLDSILQDVSLLHNLGIRFILVPSTHVLIDKLLTHKGHKAQYNGRYRITDANSLDAALEAAGRIRITVEAKLSPGPSISSVRRHGRWHDFDVAVASGNFLAAKRKGVVDGVDYGFTGEVKKIDVLRIRQRLDQDCIVILSNVGHSSTGEDLNCNTYEVATACALAVGAEKLICIIDGSIVDETGRLIPFMTIKDADQLIRTRAKQSEIAAEYVQAVEKDEVVDERYESVEEKDYNNTVTFQNGVGFDNGNGLWSGKQGFAIGGEERLSRSNGYLSELAAAAFVCRGGVQRVHLIDGTTQGALLLELFKRDGVGTMIASDVYEGTRMAMETDLPGIKQLRQPLEESGTLVGKSNQELLEVLDKFIVVERDGTIIACAALIPFEEDKCGEVASFVVSPECRGHGQGDKFLDYIEKKATSMGLEKIFILTTRTVDWFVRRGFVECGWESIPEEKRKKINLSRRSKYYMKMLQPNRRHILVS